MISDDELARLEELSARVLPVQWKSIVEGRDQTSGASFIQTGSPGEWGPDVYVHLEPLDRSLNNDVLDLIALSRELLPELLAEVRAQRAL